MTNEEIIKKIDMMITQEGTLGESSKTGKDFYIKNIETLKIVKQAVEKQIPKKPLDICTPVVTWGICPFCRGELNKIEKQTNRVFKTNAYCMDCGQALDWSDIE